MGNWAWLVTTGSELMVYPRKAFWLGWIQVPSVLWVNEHFFVSLCTNEKKNWVGLQNRASTGWKCFRSAKPCPDQTRTKPNSAAEHNHHVEQCRTRQWETGPDWSHTTGSELMSCTKPVLSGGPLKATYLVRSFEVNCRGHCLMWKVWKFARNIYCQTLPLLWG